MSALTGGQAAAGVAVSLSNLLRALPPARSKCGSVANGASVTDGTSVTDSGIGAAGAAMADVQGDADAATTAGIYGERVSQLAAQDLAVIRGAGVYFVVCCVVVLIVLLAFFVLEQQPLTRACIRRATREAEAEAAARVVKRTDVNALPKPNPQNAANAPGSLGLPLRDLAWRVRSWGAAVTLVFAVTLTLYPAITSTIAASASGTCMWRATFVPLMFLLFNLGDTVGRAAVCYIPKLQSSVLLLALARVVFAPTFIELAHSAGSSDALPIAAMLIFAVSNGWLTTAIFVCAPDSVSPADRPATGALMVLFLNVGLTLGSIASYVMSAIVSIET